MNIRKLIQIVFKVLLVSILILYILNIKLSYNKFYITIFYYFIMLFWLLFTLNPRFVINLMRRNKIEELSKFKIWIYRILGSFWILITIMWIKFI
jgi:hypothetical protein